MIFYTHKYKYSCLLDSNFSQGKFPERYFQYDAIFAFDSIKVLRSSNDSFNKLKYFYAKEHTTLYKARNLACEYASGEFIAFVDCDDWWEKNFLEIRKKKL